MTWVLALLADGWQYIAGGIAAIGTIWLARNSGKNAERAKHQKAENDGLKKHSKDVAGAVAAGRDKRVPVDQDPNNRDNQKP